MKGCRALSDEEIQRVLGSFRGKNALRNRCLVLLGIKSGFRISELLSLKVGAVWQMGQAVERVTVDRAHMKKRQEGRTVLLHPEAKAAVGLLVVLLQRKAVFGPQTYLFQSQKGPNMPLSRVGAWLVLKKTFARVQVTGQDYSVTDFRFSGEKLNPALDRKLFEFRLPPGRVLEETGN